MAVLRQVDLKKNEVNRKLIGWMFFGMGLFSMGLWLWGRQSVKKSSVEQGENPLIMKLRFDLKSTPEPQVKAAESGERIIEVLNEITATTSGEYGIYVLDPVSGSGYGVNEEVELPAASIMKVPIMATVYKLVESGEMELNDTYTLKESDKRYGSGPLEFVKAGTPLTIRRLLSEMGKKSDNTAPVVLTNLVGTEKVEDMIGKLGMKQTDFGKNTMTANDASAMWKTLYNGKILDDEHLKMMWEDLKDSIYEERLPAGLPREKLEIVHKVGTDADVWADSGIIMPQTTKPLIITILNEGVKRAEAEQMVPELTRRIWEFETSGLK